MILYKTEELLVERYDDGSGFGLTMFDEDGKDSEYVGFSREEMLEFVESIYKGL